VQYSRIPSNGRLSMECDGECMVGGAVTKRGA
jgi:hypothetical protein